MHLSGIVTLVIPFSKPLSPNPSDVLLGSVSRYLVISFAIVFRFSILPRSSDYLDRELLMEPLSRSNTYDLSPPYDKFPEHTNVAHYQESSHLSEKVPLKDPHCCVFEFGEHTRLLFRP